MNKRSIQNFKILGFATLLVFLSFVIAKSQTYTVQNELPFFNKTLRICNAVVNAELLPSVKSFTDSTGIKIFTHVKFNQKNILDKYVDSLMTYKILNLEPPYLIIHFQFTRVADTGRTFVYNGKLDISKSEDLYLPIDTINQIIKQTDTILVNKNIPSEIVRINRATDFAMKGLLITMRSDKAMLYHLWQTTRKLIVELSDSINRSIRIHTDSLKWYVNKMQPDTSKFVVAKGSNTSIGTFLALNSDANDVLQVTNFISEMSNIKKMAVYRDYGNGLYNVNTKLKYLYYQRDQLKALLANPDLPVYVEQMQKDYAAEGKSLIAMLRANVSRPIIYSHIKIYIRQKIYKSYNP